MTRRERKDLVFAARTAYRMLRRRNMRILSASFVDDTEDMVLVFARGERAEEARLLLAPLLESEGWDEAT